MEKDNSYDKKEEEGKGEEVMVAVVAAVVAASPGVSVEVRRNLGSTLFPSFFCSTWIVCFLHF